MPTMFPHGVLGMKSFHIGSQIPQQNAASVPVPRELGR